MGAISMAGNALSRGADKITSKIDSTITSVKGTIGSYTAAVSTSLKSGTMAGVNYAGLGDVNKAIETWISNIDSVLDKLQTVSTDDAFKGSQFTPKITEFVEAVKTTCHNLITEVREFETMLNQAVAAYKDRDTEMASTLSNNAESVKSTATEVEQVQHQA